MRGFVFGMLLVAASSLPAMAAPCTFHSADGHALTFSGPFFQGAVGTVKVDTASCTYELEDEGGDRITCPDRPAAFFAERGPQTLTYRGKHYRSAAFCD